MKPLALAAALAATLSLSGLPAAAQLEKTMSRVEPALSVSDSAGVLRALPATGFTSPSGVFSEYMTRLQDARKELAAPARVSGDQAVDRDVALHLMDRRIAAISEAQDAMRILDPVFTAYRASMQDGETGRASLRSIPELAERAQEAWKAQARIPAQAAQPFAQMLEQAAASVGWLRQDQRAAKQSLLALARAMTSGQSEQDGSVGLGRPAYDWLLRQELGEGRTPEQISLLGQAEISRIKARMTILAQELHPGLSLPEALKKVQADHPANDQAVIDSYASVIDRATAFNKDRGLFHVPQDFPLKIGPMLVGNGEPPIAAASFSHAYGGGAGRVNLALSNNDPKWLAVHNYSRIAAVAVHEGFPGHGYQFLEEPQERPFAFARLQHLAGRPAVEGYAFYVEKLLAENGFFSKREELGQLSLELFRAYRLVVDTGLHTGRLSREEAVRMLNEEAFLPRVEAETEVARYLRMPGQALSYFLGYWEIAAMKEAAKAALGPLFREADFHSAFLSFGPIPTPVIAQHIAQRMQSLRAGAGPVRPAS